MHRMNEFTIGEYAVSNAGHDFGQYYVILQLDGEYAYLVDGKIRTLSRPKKKKLKHIRMVEEVDLPLKDKIICQTVKNEEIKRSIKLLKRSKSNKEVK